MNSAEFHVRTRILSGLDSVSGVGREVDRLGGGRVAVIADAGVAACGLLDRIVAGAGIMPVIVVLADPNPDLSAVRGALAEVVAHDGQVIVAVGGGSALCLAKAVAICMTNDAPIESYEGSGLVSAAPAPVIAIPTTAGSGSEVSNALVLHEPGYARELVIRGSGCEPRVAILDGSVLLDLPRRPMLEAGLDALSHALESLWARSQSVITRGLAEGAIDTILRLLPGALETRSLGDLQELMEASCAANLACGCTGLGLVHALSSSPTIPLAHGYQNGALLAAVGDFNRDHLRPEHRLYIDRLDVLFEACDFSGHFEDGQVSPEQAGEMIAASDGHPFRANNVRASTNDELLGVLAAAGAAT